jgi:predicted TIM-barrel fold metal-dependent hydrolase
VEAAGGHARRAPDVQHAQAIAWLSDGTADWFWPAAEKAELAVMFLAVGEVARFARIAERHPQLMLIINHMGLNSSSRGNRVSDIPAAIDRAVTLAKYPNVSVKFSGASAIRSNLIRSAI